MKIKTIKDLKIKGSDIVQLNGGVKGSYVSEVINELASEVVLDIIQNDFMELSHRAKEIIAQMDTKVDENSTEKVELKEDAPSEMVVEEKDAALDQIDLVSLKIKFDFSYSDKVEQTYQLFVRPEMDDVAKKALKENIKEKVKRALLEQNPEYQILEERGLLK